MCGFGMRISKCEKWKRIDNVYAENGRFCPLSSVEACMKQCSSQSDCLAIDIWADDTCSLHLNETELVSSRATRQFVTVCT